MLKMLIIQIQCMEMEETASTTQTFTFCHRKTHTFAQYSSVINIMGEKNMGIKCALPGNALIGGNQKKRERQLVCY